MFDLDKYLQIALRRKYWAIIPFLVTMLGGLGYGLTAQKMYRAEALILVLPQRVPEQYIRSIVSSDIDARIKTITQQVTSRTNLERVMSEHNLFQGRQGDLGTEEKVKIMRSRITIDVGKVRGGRNSDTTAFTIAFKSPSPQVAMEVTTALVSNFISENLKLRASQAVGTATFLSDELDTMRKRLNAKEEQLKVYRQAHLGAMPNDLQTNLTVLGRLQTQLDQLNNNLMDAENRKLIIQDQISKARERRENGEYAMQPSGPGQGGPARSLPVLKQQLALLQGKYTSSHPDVIRLKKIIDRMEAEQAKRQENGPENPDQTLPGDTTNDLSAQTMDESLMIQLKQVAFGIRSIKVEIENVQAKINVYQHRVDETPKREQEFAALSRDYDNLKALYSSMLNRDLEAQIALNMEKRQQGEQFRIIDPAKLPRFPVEPDFRKIIFVIFALGIGLGGGIAYLSEIMDTSYKTPEEVEQELKLPVMVNIPRRFSEQEIRRHKVMGKIKALSVASGFLVAVLGIVIATKGMSNAVHIVKSMITRLPM